MFEHEKKFARKYIILTSTNHFAGGFGVALLLHTILPVAHFYRRLSVGYWWVISQ